MEEESFIVRVGEDKYPQRIRADQLHEETKKRFWEKGGRVSVRVHPVVTTSTAAELADKPTTKRLLLLPTTVTSAELVEDKTTTTTTHAEQEQETDEGTCNTAKEKNRGLNRLTGGISIIAICDEGEGRGIVLDYEEEETSESLSHRLGLLLRVVESLPSLKVLYHDDVCHLSR